jgi:hypothetical protein
MGFKKKILNTGNTKWTDAAEMRLLGLFVYSLCDQEYSNMIHSFASCNLEEKCNYRKTSDMNTYMWNTVGWAKELCSINLQDIEM